MNAAPSSFTATILRASAGGFAAIAAEILVERPADPAAPARMFSGYKEMVEAHLAVLATAVGLDSPPIYAAFVRWSRVANLARGIPDSELANALSALAEVVSTELPEDAAPRVKEIVSAGRAELEGEPAPPTSFLDPESPTGKVALQYMLALLEGDRRRAWNTVSEARASGQSLRDVYQHVVGPVLAELGRMWVSGEVQIAEERFATTTTELVLSQFFDEITRTPRNGRTVVVASVEGNRHHLGIRMIGDVLEHAGWRTIDLGSSIPADQFHTAAVAFNADLVALSASLSTQLDAIGSIIRHLRSQEETRDLPVLVGGAGFIADPDAWRQVGADGFAADFDGAVAEAERLTAERRPDAPPSDA